ncbi:hypothetical protein ACN38_g13070 [Penicillium nordicum]|uniref:Uncharacterized protein n=1 Tax=Penicillium nordicum TaxID=229535 RepID=A0A0M9W9D2_9EURO|nr:hypothetical protein ACN38_g13070 [Penicillium nordicum]
MNLTLHYVLRRPPRRPLLTDEFSSHTSASPSTHPTQQSASHAGETQVYSSMFVGGVGFLSLFPSFCRLTLYTIQSHIAPCTSTSTM